MWEVRDAKKKGLPPSLANVRRLLTQDTASLKAWLDTLLPDADLDIKSRLAKFLDDTNEVASIKSTIETQTSWMSSRPMRNDMAVAEGVDFRDLKKEPTTVYVILPTKELQSKATFLRLVLSSALRDIYQDGGVPCTLLVDEGFVLGHHGELESAAAILRGYFSRFSISFQSLSQASKLYSRNWETFAGGAILGFRPASNETAEWMSKRWEQYSTPVRSVGDPSGVTDFKRRDSWKPERRETISPAQMLTMPAGFAMAQRPNEPPRIVRVKGYFEIPLLARRADPNPYYQAPRKRAWFF
jgi:type IV secretion system protein VirD4